ncbi:hypothetical protein C2G38_2191598 [Gigaspora rosea]|uniref:SAP domain-containing protein n=1 Tax=Gigaspora rosea TaxID=44941 RepID=A0A397V943_9GLOM|nr:hypothetical protein C2G38_2191598 [Gigaspora rosea]CAG8489795.1 26340_t:CDS:1 [Gigaspora rosea]
MVMVEDENDLQEVLSAVLPLEEGVGYGLEELPLQGLKSTLDRLPVETLRLLCSGNGLSEAGCKKGLIERLVGRVVSKTKGKDRAKRSSQSSGTWFRESDASLAGMSLDSIFQRRTDLVEEVEIHKSGPHLMCIIALERSLEKSMQVTLEKVVGEIK